MKSGINIFSIFTLLILLSNQASPQYLIKGRFTGHFPSKVFLLDYYGQKNSILDSSTVSQNGIFEFKIPEKTRQGLISINYGWGANLDLIFTQEDIVFHAEINDIEGTITFENSINNTIFYNYLKQTGLITREINELRKTGAGSGQKNQKVYELELNRYNYALKLATENQELLAGKMIRAILIPHSPDFGKYYFSPKSDSLEWTYLRKHYLDYIDFSEERLIRSPLFVAKLNGYFNNFLPSAADDEYKYVLTSIINKTRSNGLVYDFILNILGDIFERKENTTILEWLMNTFTPTTACENDTIAKKQTLTIEKLKQLQPGRQAPDFTLPDNTNQKITLSKIKSEYTLIVFWKSSCSHCMAMMPELVSIYKKYHSKGIQFVAVSFDSNQENWLNAVGSDKKWINLSDLQGLKSPVLQLYHVVSTPRFFLLDRNKTIIGKFTDLEEVMKDFESLIK